MKKILFIFLVILMLVACCVSTSAHSLVTHPNADNVTLYRYNPVINIITGSAYEYVNAVPLNNVTCYPKTYTNAGGTYYSFSDGVQDIIDFKNGLTIGRTGTEDTVDTKYTMSSCLYNPLDYVSLYYSSPITLYNTADEVASGYCYSDIVFSNGDVNLQVEGDIILYFRIDINWVAIRVPLSNVGYELIPYWDMSDYYYSQDWLTPPADTVVPSVTNYIRSHIDVNAFDYAYCIPQPHIIARNYLNTFDTNLPVPIGYKYDNVTITLTSDTNFRFCDNNIYSALISDTNGDNYITVLELQDSIVYEVHPYGDGKDGYGIIDSIEAFLSQPFILNLSYLSWLYIIAGLTLFRYLLKLFMGG